MLRVLITTNSAIQRNSSNWRLSRKINWILFMASGKSNYMSKFYQIKMSQSILKEKRVQLLFPNARSNSVLWVDLRILNRGCGEWKSSESRIEAALASCIHGGVRP